MIIDPVVAIQTKLLAVLRDSDGPVFPIADIRVYDVVPEGALTPYVLIGDYTDADNSRKGVHADSLTWTIHGFTEGESSLDAKRLNAAVKQALHLLSAEVGSPEPTHKIYIEWEFGEVLRDPDNRSYHGVMRFRILCEQLPEA